MRPPPFLCFREPKRKEKKKKRRGRRSPQPSHRSPHRRSEGDSSNGAVTWLEMSPVSLQPSYVFERQLELPAHCSAHWMEVVVVEQATAVLLDLRRWLKRCMPGYLKDTRRSETIGRHIVSSHLSPGIFLLFLLNNVISRNVLSSRREPRSACDGEVRWHLCCFRSLFLG